MSGQLSVSVHLSTIENGDGPVETDDVDPPPLSWLWVIGIVLGIVHAETDFIDGFDPRRHRLVWLGAWLVSHQRAPV